MALCVCVLAGALLTSPSPAAERDQRKHEVVKLAEGVHAFMWSDTLNSPEPNVLIIINDDDVVVVDSSLYPSTSREVIAEIRKLSNKPVRYVINTHWHDDHVFGNSVYKDAWPGVEFIAHVNTRIDTYFVMPAVERAYYQAKGQPDPNDSGS